MNDVAQDAERDLRDVGCYINVINGCQGIDKHTLAFGITKEFASGVLFSTYHTLASSGWSLSPTRQTHLSWLHPPPSMYVATTHYGSI
jgi:hypothetical protein